MNKLTHAIKQYGQQQLANDAKVNKATVSLVANNKSSFGKDAGYRVAKILNLPLSVVLGFDE